MELTPGGDADLGEDVAQVVLDGLGAEVELGGYLPIGEPLRHQPGHRLLFGGQAVGIFRGRRAGDAHAARGQLSVAGGQERPRP